MSAGDKQAVLDCIGRTTARCRLAPTVKVHSCYEAGRDGWWLHRWLIEQGVDNIVVDSSSIEVNRRARRAKTDRLDGDKLLAMLQRYCAGERRVWAVLRTPTVQEEDARRTDRERQRLTDERTAHINRVGSLLVLHNLRAGHRHPRQGLGGLVGKRTPSRCRRCLRAEIEREVERLALVKEQIRGIEARQRQEVASDTHPLVARLGQLRAISSLKGAWRLDKELFGWRNFSNRRQLGASLGLTPTPYDSGSSQIEQGISKAGNKRAAILARGARMELAALAARQRALSQRYGRRFATAGKRMRPRRHRGAGQAPGHCVVAIPAAR